MEKESDVKNKNILIFSAHADDHIACAGTVFKLVDSGCVPYEIVLTDSEEGPDMRKVGEKQKTDSVARLRKAELSKASEFLGVKETYFLGQSDLGLNYSKELLMQTVQIIRVVKPEIGFIMNSYDWHPDHRESYKIASEAFKWAASGIRPELGVSWKTPVVLCSEGMIPVQVNVLVDITKYADKKIRLWEMYGSQATSKSIKYEEGLMQVRGYQLRKQDGYFAEGFSTDPLSPILLFEDE
jgi:LmbE family N-acetylglucosaminyl deacetylase